MERKWSSPGPWSCRTRCRASEYVIGCDGKEASCLWHRLTGQWQWQRQASPRSKAEVQGTKHRTNTSLHTTHSVPHTHTLNTRTHGRYRSSPILKKVWRLCSATGEPAAEGLPSGPGPHLGPELVVQVGCV